MLTYKNTTGKDVKITIRPTDPKDLPVEVLVKNGESYDVPEEQEAEFLRWMADAKAQDNGNKAEGATDTDEANEDVEKKSEDGDENNAETETVKNDKDFDIEVTYKKNGEDTTETVKAGAEIEVPKDEAENVKKQIADAEEKADTTSGDDNSTVSEEVENERKALAEERAKLAEERASLQFDKLCESGKVVPAQKKSFMALATRSGAALAEGEKTVSELLNDFIESAPAHSLMEEKGSNGESEKDDVELTDEDKQVAEMFGNTEEDIKNTRKDD